jgi:transcriptional antiterminator NusG
MAEVESFLEPTSDVEGISEGAIVELTGGPFSGDKAKVTDIDDSNEKVTVEMLDSTVPIPVQVRGDQIRVLDKDEWG